MSNCFDCEHLEHLCEKSVRCGDGGGIYDVDDPEELECLKEAPCSRFKQRVEGVEDV